MLSGKCLMFSDHTLLSPFTHNPILKAKHTEPDSGPIIVNNYSHSPDLDLTDQQQWTPADMFHAQSAMPWPGLIRCITRTLGISLLEKHCSADGLLFETVTAH